MNITNSSSDTIYSIFKRSIWRGNFADDDLRCIANWYEGIGSDIDANVLENALSSFEVMPLKDALVLYDCKTREELNEKILEGDKITDTVLISDSGNYILYY